MGKVSKNDVNNIIDGVIQLKKEFTRTSGTSTFIHKQIYYANGWYIYQLSPYNFEVFKEKVINGVTNEGGIIKTDKTIKKVKYPNDEDFGNWAWSVSSLECALKYIEFYS